MRSDSGQIDKVFSEGFSVTFDLIVLCFVSLWRRDPLWCRSGDQSLAYPRNIFLYPSVCDIVLS